MNAPQLLVEHFFDLGTWTVSYLVMDKNTGQAAIIDSVLGYDPKSGRTNTKSADMLLERVDALAAKVDWVLETHVHADHFTASVYLQEKLRAEGHLAKTGIGKHVTVVQEVFKKLFNVEETFATDGSQFDHLFTPGEIFTLGDVKVEVLHTPGHTPACSVYKVTDPAEPDVPSCFVGDTLFMPDYGTARCDFPGGSAKELYHSIQKILALPAATRLYMCHDYLPNGREFAYLSTVAEMNEKNIHIHAGVSEESFVTMRTERDAQLDMPVLILPSVQINMRAGHFPLQESNGLSYIKIPINAL